GRGRAGAPRARGGCVSAAAAWGGGRGRGGADVPPRLDAGEPGGEGGRGAAGGAAGAARVVPRIVGGAVDGVVALIVRQVDRHVGLAEEHYSRRQEAIHGERVARRQIVLELGHASGSGHAHHVVGFLDGHGHAVERPPHLLAGERAVRRAGPLARA